MKLTVSIAFTMPFSASFQSNSATPAYTKPCNAMNPTPATNATAVPIRFAATAVQYPIIDDSVNFAIRGLYLATSSFSFGAYGSDMVHESINLLGSHVSYAQRGDDLVCKMQKECQQCTDCRTNVDKSGLLPCRHRKIHRALTAVWQVHDVGSLAPIL